MKKYISTWSQGINQDISTNKYPNTNFYWAQNFRVVSKDGLATGALTNVKGTTAKLGLGVGHTITSSCTIRDTLILFVASDEGGKIFKWDYTDNNDIESPTLVYTDPNLNFTVEKPIRAVGRYENEFVQKIYFTDGDTFFKHLNIIPQEGESYPLNNFRSLDSLDLVSDMIFPTIELELSVGGNLKAGKIQYAYQLYSKRGSESVFSPASDMIHLTESDESRDSYDYHGSEIGTNVNKSVIVNINDIDPNNKKLFTRLRLVALEYSVYEQIPSVRIVGEYNIESKNLLSVTDNGSSIGEFTLEEFRFIQNDIFPKTLDIKNDYLFIANLKNNYFEVKEEEFDARAFRFNKSKECRVFNGNNSIVVNPDWSNIPNYKEESYNRFNDWTNDYIGNSGHSDTYAYKYRSDGATLGGDGPNISYEFTIDKVLLDDAPVEAKGWMGYLPKQVIGNSESSNYVNPLLSIGYKRDEVYRFGIVFFDKKGRPSFVKWIGDIRFPNNKEFPFISYTDDGVKRTFANILGIRFEVRIPISLKNKISGYQIVRAYRSNSDKTILTQAVMNYMKDGGRLNHSNQTLAKAMYSHATPTYISECIVKKTLVTESTSSISRTPDDKMGSKVDNYRGANQKLRGDYLDLVSPEIVFNKSSFSTANAYIEVEGYINQPSKTAICGPSYSDSTTMVVSEKYRNYGYSPEGTYKLRRQVDSYKIFRPQLKQNTGSVNLDASIHVLESGVKFNNQCATGDVAKNSLGKFGQRGTFAMVSPVDEFVFPGAWGGNNDKRLFIVNYRLDKGKSLYGGSTYENRVNTIYYPASKFIDKNFNSSFNPGDINNNALIQLINSTSGFLLDIEDIMRVSTIKYMQFYISNYGTSDLNISSIGLSDNVNWAIDTVPDTIIPSGSTSLCKISYIGPESGISYCEVTINSDAINSPSLAFTLGVDYINEYEDYVTGINPPSEVTPPDPGSDTSGVRVFNGDTFINYMWYFRSMWDASNRNPDFDIKISDNIIEVVDMFPFESSINVDLRLDRPEDYMNWGYPRSGETPNYKLLELLKDGVATFGPDYPVDVGNLYRYNSVYSTFDKSKEYYPEPFDYDYTLINDVRIAASEQKINGEYIDSWTKFKFSNYIDVDSKHHAITKIITFKNYLFYFQPTAVGIASVNARSIIQDGQPGDLVLGTGGILTRYDYVTDKSGSEFYDSIVASDDFLFYGDGRRKRVNKIVPGKEVAVSVVKGIDSTLDKLPWNKVRAGFDRGYNEVIFSIDDKSLAFSESADAFVSNYTFNPSHMVTIGKDFFSVGESNDLSPWLYSDSQADVVGYSDNADEDYILIGPGGKGETLYKHNSGNPGEFYTGGAAIDSYITLIINPEGNNICYFDNLELITESRNNGVDDPEDIFYLLEASNNYQDINRTLSFTMNSIKHTGTIKRIGRIWRTPIVTGNTSLGYYRMVDTYLKLTLRYQNKGNVFRVHDITTYYRPSNH